LKLRLSGSSFILLLLALASIIVAVVLRSRFAGRDAEVVKVVTREERTPICPWRNPSHDLAQLFPGATGYVAENVALSGVMAAAQKRLGRPLAPDENPLRVYHVTNERGPMGTILVRRVKGEHGGIEIVTGMDERQAIRGVLVQSHREPPEVAQALTSSNWLRGFIGLNAGSSFDPAAGLPSVPAVAAPSAHAVVEGVHSEAILFEFAAAGGATQNHAEHR